MRWVDDPKGEYPRVPWFDWQEVEDAMTNFLNETGSPTISGKPAIDIERVLTRLGIGPDYKDLPEGVHGVTGPNDEGEIIISISSKLVAEALANPRKMVRLRSTQAHELGHYYLHKEVIKSVAGGFLCREEII